MAEANNIIEDANNAPMDIATDNATDNQNQPADLTQSSNATSSDQNSTDNEVRQTATDNVNNENDAPLHRQSWAENNEGLIFDDNGDQHNAPMNGNPPPAFNTAGINSTSTHYNPVDTWQPDQRHRQYQASKSAGESHYTHNMLRPQIHQQQNRQPQFLSRQQQFQTHMPGPHNFHEVPPNPINSMHHQSPSNLINSTPTDPEASHIHAHQSSLPPPSFASIVLQQTHNLDNTAPPQQLTKKETARKNRTQIITRCDRTLTPTKIAEQIAKQFTDDEHNMLEAVRRDPHDHQRYYITYKTEAKRRQVTTQGMTIGNTTIPPTEIGTKCLIPDPPYYIDEDSILTLLRPYGNVTSSDWRRTKGGTITGGFIFTIELADRDLPNDITYCGQTMTIRRTDDQMYCNYCNKPGHAQRFCKLKVAHELPDKQSRLLNALASREQQLIHAQLQIHKDDVRHEEVQTQLNQELTDALKTTEYVETDENVIALKEKLADDYRHYQKTAENIHTEEERLTLSILDLKMNIQRNANTLFTNNTRYPMNAINQQPQTTPLENAATAMQALTVQQLKAQLTTTTLNHDSVNAELDHEKVKTVELTHKVQEQNETANQHNLLVADQAQQIDYLIKQLTQHEANAETQNEILITARKTESQNTKDKIEHDIYYQNTQKEIRDSKLAHKMQIEELITTHAAAKVSLQTETATLKANMAIASKKLDTQAIQLNSIHIKETPKQSKKRQTKEASSLLSIQTSLPSPTEPEIKRTNINTTPPAAAAEPMVTAENTTPSVKVKEKPVQFRVEHKTNKVKVHDIIYKTTNVPKEDYTMTTELVEGAYTYTLLPKTKGLSAFLENKVRSIVEQINKLESKPY